MTTFSMRLIKIEPMMRRRRQIFCKVNSTCSTSSRTSFFDKMHNVFVSPHACIGTFVVILFKNHYFIFQNYVVHLLCEPHKKISIIFGTVLSSSHFCTQAATISNRKVPFLFFSFLHACQWLSPRNFTLLKDARRGRNAKEQV